MEIDTIYGLAPSQATQPRCLAASDTALVFGWSPNASVIALSRAASALICTPDLRVTEQFAPETEPTPVRRVRERLLEADPASALTASGGPSYVFPRAVADQDVSMPIIVSDAAGRSEAREFIRPDNWQPGEWNQLISGEIGEWAMALNGREPVSICHTPAATVAGAEAGVWTRSDHRRAGLAGAVTVAWWKRARSRHDTIFYSTRSDNFASRAVARKLGLRPLGWLWTVR